jgi:hypothetical protein
VDAPLPPRYRPIRLLGRGATAEVVLAHDHALDRDVAVKLLAPGFRGDPSVPERFAREAGFAARLGRHPHVVTVHDAGEWHGRPFIVMEFLPGGSVEDRRAAGKVTRASALGWLRDAADAVDAAHAAGVVHRDLKPANLLLDHGDRVQVADFGIARALDEARKRLTSTGTILGTAGYLSPEQARGDVATPASDRYSLAVVAHELLHGHRPAADTRLDAVFARALADDPSQRFATATAFVDALEGHAAAATAIVRGSTSPTAGRTAILRRHRAIGRAARIGGRTFATAVAGAVAAFLVLAFGYVTADAPASVTCTLSPTDHDANVVVTGVGANDYCTGLARQLAWRTRPGFALRSPDRREHPTLVCALRRRGFRIRVYDDGGRRIGRDLCSTYTGNELASAGA